MHWKPIETVPKKQGEQILLCRAGDPVVVQSYWWPRGQAYGSNWVGWYKPEPPTHWLEIPAVPAAPQEREEHDG